MEAIGSLRNSDGIGHGRPTRSPLDRAHATFAHEAALCWCRWLLATTTRVVATRAAIDAAVREIEGSRAFHRGELPDYLEDLGLATRSSSDQRRLGIAVARRWRDNHTFTPRLDVIDPAAAGSEEYPAPFVVGVIEGLLLDRNGCLRLSAGDAERVAGLARSLPSADLPSLDALADTCSDALPAPGFDAVTQQATARALRELRRDHGSEVAFLQRLIEQIESFLGVGAPDAVDSTAATDE